MRIKMDKQRFRAWHPIDGVPKRLYLEAIHDDYEGLRFLLRGEELASPMLRLAFEPPIAFRNINESYRLKTWAGKATSGDQQSLLEVENSRWIEWLVEEAAGVLDSEELVHYAIYTAEDCIDVVTEIPPRVSWLNT